jgi:hypothetical protein
MAKWRVGVEYSLSMLEPVRPGAVSPDRTLCLPTFSHFLIVNKTSLSLSLSLALALALSLALALAGSLSPPPLSPMNVCVQRRYMYNNIRTCTNMYTCARTHPHTRTHTHLCVAAPRLSREESSATFAFDLVAKNHTYV